MVPPWLTNRPLNKDTIISCLPTPAVAEQVFTMLATGTNPRPGRLTIDCSTIDPVTSRRVRTMMERSSCGTFIDAPMSGGVVGARAGTLSFMVGGSESSFAAALPTLQRMGRRVIHCGEQGTGLSAKLANNYLLAINNLATAEAMNFGIKAGLRASTLAEIINSATGQNWACQVNNPVPGVVGSAPASRDYTGGFAAGLMHKDLTLAITAAQGVQAPLPMAGVAAELYGALSADAEYAGLDFSVIYKYLQQAKAKL